MLLELIKINGNLVKLWKCYCRPPSTYQSNTLHKNFGKMAHLIFNSKMFSEAMLRILQHPEKHGWICVFPNRNKQKNEVRKTLMLWVTLRVNQNCHWGILQMIKQYHSLSKTLLAGTVGVLAPSSQSLCEPCW